MDSFLVSTGVIGKSGLYTTGSVSKFETRVERIRTGKYIHTTSMRLAMRRTSALFS